MTSAAAAAIARRDLPEAVAQATTSGPAVELHSTQMAEAFRRLVDRLDDLTEEESHWEAVPDPSTLRWKADGR